MSPHLTFRTFLTSAVVLGAACGGAGGPRFSPTFPDNRSDAVARVVAQLEAEPPPVMRAVAVAVSAKPSHLVAFDLTAGQRLWERQPSDPRGAAHVAGDTVVTHEGNDVVARALDTGAEYFRVDHEHMHLVGADGDGAFVAIVLSTGAGIAPTSRLIIASGGAVRHDLELEHSMGAPAVRAGMVFLPWDNQNLSVFDARSGDELARLRATDAVISTALGEGRSVLFGDTGVFKFDATATSGSKAAATYLELGPGALPGGPRFLVDRYRAPPLLAGAEQRVRLAWRAGVDGTRLALTDGNLYFTYYRAIFALEGGARRARWAHALPADVVGAQAVPGGLLVGTQDGSVMLLDAQTGTVAWKRPLGRTAAAITFRAGTFSPGAASGPRDAGASLTEVAMVTDARIAPAQVLAVELLAMRPEESVTGDLIALCEHRRGAKPVREAACKALGERTKGAEEVMLALTRHAAFLEDAAAPPAGALGLAAVKMKLSDAVPLLVAHLKDPHTPSEELPGLVTALRDMGSRATYAPLRDFVRLYHAEVWEVDLAKALGIATTALLDLGGPASRDILEELRDDPHGMSEVRDDAEASLQKLDAAAAAATAKDQAKNPKADATADGAEAPSGPPLSLTAAHTAAALANVQGGLRACAQAAEANLRIVMLVAPEGRVNRVSVTPASAEGCVQPLVSTQTFPATRAGRPQQVIHTVKP